LAELFGEDLRTPYDPVAINGRVGARKVARCSGQHNKWDDWKWWLPDKCAQTQAVYGSEPSAPGRYPVLLYLHSALADWNGNVEGRRTVELAAAQGFVAAAVSYDSWVVYNQPDVLDGNAKCIFSPGSAGNALASVCARPQADCSKGVLVAGASVGGLIAARAANFAPQVRAAWLIGVNGPAIQPLFAVPAGTRALPNDRLRINVGRGDVAGGLAALNQMTGMGCSTSPCLRADGSGYYVVEHSEVADGVADHCYWQSVNTSAPYNSCTGNPTFDPGFRPPSTRPCR
jgi:hypothetical protein